MANGTGQAAVQGEGRIKGPERPGGLLGKPLGARVGALDWPDLGDRLDARGYAWALLHSLDHAGRLLVGLGDVGCGADPRRELG